MGTIRKRHTKQTKFDAAIALIKGNMTITELCQKYSIHQSVLTRWKRELLEKGPDIFDIKSTKEPENNTAIEKLQRKIGELTMDIDFLKKALGD